MGFGDRCFAAVLGTGFLAALWAGLAARAPMDPLPGAEPGQAHGQASSQVRARLASKGARVEKVDPAEDAGRSELWSDEQLRRWEGERAPTLGVRESPPKNVAAFSSPLIQSARALTQAALAAQRVAPGCVAPTVHKAGAFEEGWSLAGPRIETRRKNCGPEEMEAAWRAVDASGAPAQGAFLMAQDLTMEQAWALARRIESGGGGEQDYQRGLAALNLAESRAGSEQARLAWDAQLAALQQEMADGLAGKNGVEFSDEMRQVARDYLALSPRRWREIKLKEERFALEASRRWLMRSAGEAGLVAGYVPPDDGSQGE